VEIKRDQGKRMRQEKPEGIERKEGKSKEETYRIFLVGFGGLDLLVKAVDLVLEVLHVLLVFFLLLNHFFQTSLLLLAELLLL